MSQNEPACATKTQPGADCQVKADQKIERLKPHVAPRSKEPKKPTKKSPFDTFEARTDLISRFVKAHKRAAEVGVPELSPVHERPGWLAFCSFVVNDENWGYSDEALEILKDVVRSGREEEDEEQVEKDFSNESWPVDNNIVATAGNIARWIDKLRGQLAEVEVTKQRATLKENGLHVVRFGNKGNQAIDIESIVKRFEGGARPSDSYGAMDANGLKTYNFTGANELAMEGLAGILPIKQGWLWQDCLRGAADYFLCSPTDYTTFNIFPRGAGPFARDPLQHIEVPSYSLVKTYRGIKYGEDQWPSNPLENDDLRIWVETLRWWAKTDAELHWLISWIAHGIQNPWERVVTSPLIGGKTRSGKTRAFLAVNACFTTGASVITLKRLPYNTKGADGPDKEESNGTRQQPTAIPFPRHR